jgi:DNA-binding CsgD family transcriptional regulator
MLSRDLLAQEDILCLLELSEQSLYCKEKNDLLEVFDKLKCLIPFDFAVCGLAKTDSKRRIKSHDMVNISYPDEWIDLYVAQNYYKIDPIVKENFNEFKLQYWADTYRKNRPPNDFLSGAMDFGLKKGYTDGIRNPHGTKGSIFSLSSKSLKRHDRTEAILNYLIPFLHEALIRILGQPEDKTIENKISLTARQIEVLNWLKLGKSTWDISEIIGISERTVKFHIDTAMRNLDVVNRIQAVVVAIAQGFIDVD